MTDAHIRLQQARRQAGYETATDAARAFGWNENTYRSHENAERGLKSGVASKYAKALRVNLLWLLYGEIEPEDRTSSSIIGLINDGGKVSLLYDEKIEVNLPISIPDDGKCFWINCNTMYPRYAKGDLVVCWPDVMTDKGGTDRFNEGIIVMKNKEVYFGSLLYSEDDQLFEIFARPPIRKPAVEVFHPAQIVVRLGRYNLHNLADRDRLSEA